MISLMQVEDRSPAERWRSKVAGQWANVAMDRGLELIRDSDDMRAVSFACATRSAIVARNHTRSMQSQERLTFTQARAHLAKELHTHDSVLRKFMTGERQIERVQFQKAMVSKSEFGPLIWHVPNYLLPYAALDVALPDGVQVVSMNRLRTASITAAHADRDLTVMREQVARLTQQLARAQRDGRPRRPDEPDWVQVAETVNRPRSKSLHNEVWRLLVEHGTLSTDSVHTLLLKRGTPTTIQAIRTIMSRLKQQGLTVSPETGVHSVAPWPPAQSPPGEQET